MWQLKLLKKLAEKAVIHHSYAIFLKSHTWLCALVTQSWGLDCSLLTAHGCCSFVSTLGFSSLDGPCPPILPTPHSKHLLRWSVTQLAMDLDRLVQTFSLGRSRLYNLGQVTSLLWALISSFRKTKNFKSSAQSLTLKGLPVNFLFPSLFCQSESCLSSLALIASFPNLW